MSWAYIRDSDGAMIGTPVAQKPTSIPPGQHIVQVPLGYPDVMAWSPAKRGFVDLLSKDQLLAQIDAAAGVARLKWITMVPGQPDAYREKMVDVASLNTLGSTTALILTALGAIPLTTQKARWPFLYAEMQARGLANVVQARDAIVAAAESSRAARAEIERIRRTGKIAVTAATTLAAANTAATAVTFPS